MEYGFRSAVLYEACAGKTERQRGKGKYEYIPEYDSAGFSNTVDVKHNTPRGRRGFRLHIRQYRGQDLKCAGSAFVPGVCVTLKCIHRRKISTPTRSEEAFTKKQKKKLFMNTF